MSALIITAEGQISLREELLQHLGAAPGDKIAVEKLPDRRIEIRAARAKGTRKISDVFGCLKRENGPKLTIEEIGEAAADGWAGKR